MPNTMLVNNTASDIRLVEPMIWAAINANPEAPALPASLADLFTLTRKDVGGATPIRYILEFA